MWTDKKIAFEDEMNRMKINRMRRKIQEFDQDERKEYRLKEKLCKSCFYLRNNLSLQAFTKSKCKNCDNEIINPNSDVNKFCNKCSEERCICVKCGGHID